MNINTKRKLAFLFLGFAMTPNAHAQSDFASTVVSYTPAPGQLVNNASFNDPGRALGPPVAGGTIAPDNTSLVTLGGFGGAITLAFDHTVLDDPHNTLGLDFIVFGNAFWSGGNPNSSFAEPGTIEISLDTNNDGVANDPWFLIPGSNLPTTAQTVQSQEWDNDPQTPLPPATIAWYPTGAPSPMTTFGFLLPAPLDPGAWGYADLSPTLILGDLTGANGSPGDNSLNNPEDNPAIDPAEFYTVPDDPFTVGVDPNSGGGDALDIAWAIDANTGASANLAGFDFVRITTAVNATLGPLGEVSTEIDAIADVRPTIILGDLTGDGFVDGADLAALLINWGTDNPAADLNADGVVNGADLATLLTNWSPAP